MKTSRATVINVLIIASISILTEVGFVCGLYPTNAVLVHRAGATSLFSAYAWSSIMVLAFAAVFLRLADRYSRRRVFLIVHVLMGCEAVGAWWIIHQQTTSLWLYPTLWALFYGNFVVLTLQFWILASDHFTNHEARRFYPHIIAAGIVGSLLGGVLIDVLAPHLASEQFLLVWALLLFCTPGALVWLQRPLRPRTPRLARPVSSAPFTAVPLVRILFLFWLVYSLLCYGIDYLFVTTSVAHMTTEAQLTAWFGQVVALASAGILVYALLLVHPLTRWLGIDRAIALIPCVAVIACGLAWWHPTLTTLALGEGLLFFFADFAGATLLHPVLNVFARQQSGQIKIFTDGVGCSVGKLLLFLLAMGLLTAAQLHHLPLILLGIALGFMILPFWFHRVYVRHLVACLRSDDQELVINAIHALGEPNKHAAVRPLLTLLRDTTEIHLQRSIILSLGQIRSGEALSQVVALFAVRNEVVQSAVMDALSQYNNYEGMLAMFRLLKSGQNVSLQVRMNAVMLLTRLAGRAMIPFLLEALDNPDVRVQANTIEALGTLRDRKVVPLLRPFLQHANHRVRASAIIALYGSCSTRQRRELRQRLQAMFTSSGPLERLAALYAIGELRLRVYIPELTTLLQTPDRQVQQLAATALAKMPSPHGTVVFTRLLIGPDDAFGIATAKRMAQFPPTSRGWIFEAIAELPDAQRVTAMHRVDASGLDFTAEKELLARAATALTYTRW